MSNPAHGEPVGAEPAATPPTGAPPEPRRAGDDPPAGNAAAGNAAAEGATTEGATTEGATTEGAATEPPRPPADDDRAEPHVTTDGPGEPPADRTGEPSAGRPGEAGYGQPPTAPSPFPPTDGPPPGFADPASRPDAPAYPQPDHPQPDHAAYPGQEATGYPQPDHAAYPPPDHAAYPPQEATGYPQPDAAAYPPPYPVQAPYGPTPYEAQRYDSPPPAGPPGGSAYDTPYDPPPYDVAAYDQPPPFDTGYAPPYPGGPARPGETAPVGEGGPQPPHPGYPPPGQGGPFFGPPYDSGPYPPAPPGNGYPPAPGPLGGPGAHGPATDAEYDPAGYDRTRVPGPLDAYGRPGPPLPPLPPQGGVAPPPHETADSLSPDTLLRGRRTVPLTGWRRVVYRATGGMIDPGESPAERRRRELVARVRTPVAGGHHRVAVLSLKGGVGKTTTTVGLGASLASLRGDRVIAVDANPDRGTLSDKVRLETAATVRDLLNERDHVHRYADVRGFTSQATSRLEVLASDRDPAVSVAFSEDDYASVAEVLENYYSICITDCGTGLLHSAMAGVLRLADQIVLVSSPSVDGARSASATLDWLEAHEFGDLVRGGVVVLSMIRPKSKSSIDLDRLEQHFAARCRAVVRIPYDAHLEEGAELDLDELSPETADSYLLLAATVGDGFAWPRRIPQPIE